MAMLSGLASTLPTARPVAASTVLRLANSLVSRVVRFMEYTSWVPVAVNSISSSPLGRVTISMSSGRL